MVIAIVGQHKCELVIYHDTRKISCVVIYKMYKAVCSARSILFKVMFPTVEESENKKNFKNNE